MQAHLICAGAGADADAGAGASLSNTDGCLLDTISNGGTFEYLILRVDINGSAEIYALPNMLKIKRLHSCNEKPFTN